MPATAQPTRNHSRSFRTLIPSPRRFIRCISRGTIKKERTYALCSECYKLNGSLERALFLHVARNAECEAPQYSYRRHPQFEKACEIYARRMERAHAFAAIDRMIPRYVPDGGSRNPSTAIAIIASCTTVCGFGWPLASSILVTYVLLWVAVSIRVVEYVREDGSIPFKEWFDLLDPAAAAKVAAAQTRLSQGNTSSVKWFAGLGEYIIDWGPGYRVYLARDGENLIVLFGGGTKQRQQRDINRAKELLVE